ncbi:mevalonate kinase [Candidatus Woesearchaeota archaeon]|nr:mevalonate kinase [Candidatus Woesearchaeota archaeon]
METMSRAPGKLMLLGEHAVVYGRKCIVTAVDAPVTVSLRSHEKFVINAPDLKISHEFTLSDPEYPKEVSFAATAVKMFNAKFALPSPVSITTKSLLSSERKVGLGSSASVTAAVMKALSNHFSIKLEKKELFDLCYKTILEVQKVGSGFDAAAAVFGGTLMYKKGQPMPIKSEGLDLTIGYTGMPAHTTEIVRKVAAQVDEQPGYYENIFDEIEKLVIMATKAIEEKDWASLGSLMNENQEFLREMQVPSEELGVSSEIIEKLINSALDAGAYGAKLSGAGVGDCIIAISPIERKNEVEEAIARAGGTIIDAKVNVPGAE